MTPGESEFPEVRISCMINVCFRSSPWWIPLGNTLLILYKYILCEQRCWMLRNFCFDGVDQVADSTPLWKSVILQKYWLNKYNFQKWQWYMYTWDAAYICISPTFDTRIYHGDTWFDRHSITTISLPEWFGIFEWKLKTEKQSFTYSYG